MQRILIATRNAHKTREIREILGAGFDISDTGAHPAVPEVEETGSTFEENAVLKAVAASRHFDGIVLADDSGLEVDALGSAPGVFSARYAGPDADDEKNRRHLLDELQRAGARGRERSARFRCVIALAKNGECIGTFDGTIEGVIINQPRGTHGFGYDPLFVPEGCCETFAQLAPELKNRLSHRARALAKACTFLRGS